MPADKYFSQEHIQIFTDALDEIEAQPPQRLNKRDMITLLAKKINTLREKGYSLDEIADKLREKGLKISTLTLKRYLLPGNLEQRKERIATLVPKETKKTHKTRQVSPSTTKHTALFENGQANFVDAGETLPPTNQEPSLENGKTNSVDAGETLPPKNQEPLLENVQANSVDAVETDELPPIEIKRYHPPANQEQLGNPVVQRGVEKR